MRLAGFSGFSGRYLAGLIVATLGLCAAGWLALAPVAFGYRNADPGDAALTDWATGAGLAVVSLVTLICWVVTWRSELRADGILARASRQQTRREARREARAQRRRERDGQAATARTPDPAQVLSELRALLIPLLAEPPAHPNRGWPDLDHDEAGFRASCAEPDYYQRDGYQPAPAEADGHQFVPAVPAARSGGLAAMESMLAGAELLMVGCGEEEAW